jgi:hypothetical protein
MSNKTKITLLDEVKRGVRTAVGVILVISWICLLAAGIGIAFSRTSHSAILGWLFLVVAAVVAAVTVDRWVKILPLFIGMGTLNAFITLLTGHVGTNASYAVPRANALIMLVCLLVSAIFARTLASRRLNPVDRVALLAFLVSTGWTVITDLNPGGFVAMSICLAAAWAFERSQRRRSPQDGT